MPPDLSDILIIELQPNQYGQGFSPKLHLDKISPADNTLFVDADCLCVGSLESVFDRCKGHTVSVIGKTILEGDFFGDVQSIRKRFSLNYLPYFVGGLYYFEKGDFRSGYYRDQTFMMAIGALSSREFFAQLYAHASSEAEPSS
ncbi:MAG: hypothetical protein ACK46E_15105, partial [Pseudanabaena sp.]